MCRLVQQSDAQLDSANLLLVPGGIQDNWIGPSFQALNTMHQQIGIKQQHATTNSHTNSIGVPVASSKASSDCCVAMQLS